MLLGKRKRDRMDVCILDPPRKRIKVDHQFEAVSESNRPPAFLLIQDQFSCSNKTDRFERDRDRDGS